MEKLTDVRVDDGFSARKGARHIIEDELCCRAELFRLSLMFERGEEEGLLIVDGVGEELVFDAEEVAAIAPHMNVGLHVLIAKGDAEASEASDVEVSEESKRDGEIVLVDGHLGRMLEAPAFDEASANGGVEETNANEQLVGAPTRADGFGERHAHDHFGRLGEPPGRVATQHSRHRSDQRHLREDSAAAEAPADRKSTRLNSSHVRISYAV